MSFDYGKCKEIHFGKENRENVYSMKLDKGEIHLLEKTDLERDLGILVSKDLKWGNQVEKEVKSSNSIIAQIKNSITYFYAELDNLLYLSMVRPHLKYAVSVWNPYLRKDIDKLESV